MWRVIRIATCVMSLLYGFANFSMLRVAPPPQHIRGIHRQLTRIVQSPSEHEDGAVQMARQALRWEQEAGSLRWFFLVGAVVSTMAGILLALPRKISQQKQPDCKTNDPSHNSALCYRRVACKID